MLVTVGPLGTIKKVLVGHFVLVTSQTQHVLRCLVRVEGNSGNDDGDTVWLHHRHHYHYYLQHELNNEEHVVFVMLPAQNVQRVPFLWFQEIGRAHV